MTSKRTRMPHVAEAILENLIRMKNIFKDG